DCRRNALFLAHRESVIAGSGPLGVYAPPRGAPDAKEETTRPGSSPTGGLLGWIHHHIGHLTPLIHGLVPGRAGLIIGDAAHDHGGRGDRQCTERGSRYRRTNDRASDSPGRIAPTGIIPAIAIAVTMVIIGPVLPTFLPLLCVALPTFLLLLCVALPIF